jgi:hypothetical protein
MEREQNQFSSALLRMMRDEERGKFLEALKNGASWGQLYQIRNTIKKLNDMIEGEERIDTSSGKDPDSSGREADEGPRGNSGNPRRD